MKRQKEQKSKQERKLIHLLEIGEKDDPETYEVIAGTLDTNLVSQMGSVYSSMRRSSYSRIKSTSKIVPIFDTLQDFKSWVEDQEAKKYLSQLAPEAREKLQRYLDKHGRLP